MSAQAKTQAQPSVPVMNVEVTCSHPSLTFHGITHIMGANEPAHIPMPLAFTEGRKTVFNFGDEDARQACQGVFALGIVKKDDPEREIQGYAVFAFKAPAGKGEVRHFMTLAECEPNLDLNRYNEPLKHAYEWNFKHRLMPNNCPIFHGGDIDGIRFLVRGTIERANEGKMFISLEEQKAHENIFYHEPHFFAAPRAKYHPRLNRQNSFEHQLNPPSYIVSDPEDSLFVNVFVEHPDIVLRKASHFVVTGMVGDDLTSEVSLDKPGTGYFLSTLDGKSRGNIVYEVVTAQDHANGVTYPQKDRHFLVVSWQVNPSKPKPSQEQIVEEDGDHRYKLAAMVVKADSPGFPLRGFSQKQFFDTIANHVLAGDTQEWTYPLRDGVSFNLVASIKGRDSHMEEYTNGEMFGKYQSAARKYAESPEAFDKQPITLLATEHNVNVGPGHDSAQLLAKAVSASRTSAAAAPPSSPDTNDDGYLEPAVLDIFVTLPGPPKTSKFKDIYTGYMLYAPASGFYWKNHEALLDINRVIENRLTLKDEEPLMLVEHNENSVMQLRRIYETPLSGRRIMSIRPGDRAVMLPLRYDLYDLILKPGKTCRRIYAVEELHATTLVSKHRQYVVNSFLIGRAGASVVYGMMDTADAPDDGAAITRFLDIVRVDLLALPGGLFEYSAPLLHRGQIYVKHFLSFGGPNVASTNISTCRPHIDAENNNLSMEGSGYGSKTTLRIQFLNIHPQVKVASTSVLSLSCRCLPSGIVHKELSENQETFTVDIANVVTHAAEGFAACLQIKLAEANGDSDLQAIEVYIYKVASSDADKPIYVARSLLRTKKSCAADKEQHVEVPDVIPAEEQIDGQNNYKEHCVDSDSSEDEDEDEDGDVSMSLVDKTKKRERTSIPRIVRPRPDDNDVLTETCILNTANLARSTRGLDSLGEGYISGCNRCFVGTRLGYNENDGITTLLAVAASLPNVARDTAEKTMHELNSSNYTTAARACNM